MDLCSFLGLFGGLALIVGGQMLEGGNPLQLIQLTAGMIVLGGTWGATFVSFPPSHLIFAFKNFMRVFLRKAENVHDVIDLIVEFSGKARKEGIVSLESELPRITNPFMKKALMMAIDGADPKELKNAMETELRFQEEHAEVAAKVWEAAGGYSPTIGIIGAVIGLIQVMQNLENIEEVGKGIAVAFVATIYGLVTANLIYLPSATKIKVLNHAEANMREMILEGVGLIVEGVNPMIIRDRLASYTVGEKAKQAKEEKPAK